MRAITYDHNGPASVLQLVDRDPDRPGPGEVRVRVAVSAVNPTDWQARSGLLRPTVTTTVPHQDGAGVVDAVGSGVDGLRPGDPVWTDLAAFGRPLGGTAQELTVLPVDRVHRLPDGVSFDVGATLGVAGITAHRALTVTEGWPARLSPGALAGATVLVAGGAGAVGHAAVQLARWAGATVIATVSTPAKARLATAAGAHHVVTYRESDAAERIRELAPAGVDTVVEVAAAANASLDTAVLAQGGAVVAYANAPGEQLVLDMLPLMNLNARVQLVRLFAIPPTAYRAAIEDVTTASPVLHVGEDAGLPLHRFALERAAEAHAAAEAGVVGKVLVDVAAL
ncbi:MAG TPA: zinc-binding dehydrogenase [Luteimicrobium sp.]|nr:zinc-binding dehydrogenase [Luteimicrobium sp.]